MFEAIIVGLRGLGLILASAVIFLAVAAAPAAAQPCGDVSLRLRQQGDTGALRARTVAAFYDAFGPGCAWDEDSARALIEALRAAGEHGLDPALFHGDRLSRQDDAATTGDRAAKDVLLTDAALRYAEVMTQGLSGAPDSDEDRPASRTTRGQIGRLVAALAKHDVAGWIASLGPKSGAYTGLQAALRMYKSIAENGGFPIMPDDLATKSRRKLRDYAQLRRRLAMEGDLASDSGSNQYDDELIAGIEHFQQRNGLQVNGRVTWKTLERLNISAAERVAQIELNLERLRAAEEAPATRVEVNLPAATALFYRNGAEVLIMNAVVGAVGHETPTLSSAIDTIIVNPTWTIPESIVENEIKPAMKRTKRYLSKNHMYWAGDQLVQEAGPHNSLGRIKFDFPNKYSVYLHDTPARHLFADPERAQSHGCVRLERPLDLAEELLRDNPRWDRAALQEAIDAGATRRIALSEPMPVVIVYRTVFVADDGTVNFRPDTYGLDTKLTLDLAQRAGEMR